MIGICLKVVLNGMYTEVCPGSNQHLPYIWTVWESAVVQVIWFNLMVLCCNRGQAVHAWSHYAFPTALANVCVQTCINIVLRSTSSDHSFWLTKQASRIWESCFMQYMHNKMTGTLLHCLWLPSVCQKCNIRAYYVMQLVDWDYSSRDYRLWHAELQSSKDLPGVWL